MLEFTVSNLKDNFRVASIRTIIEIYVIQMVAQHVSDVSVDVTEAWLTGLDSLAYSARDFKWRLAQGFIG